MDRPIEQLFSPPELSVTDVTGKLPSWCSYQMPYAKAERRVIKEGTIVSQYHSHVLFFIEVMEINLHRELEASYVISNPSLFLFMVLGGEVTFYTSNGQSIANAPEAVCYATYNKTGRYVYKLSAGIHRFCYLCPMPSWLNSNIKRYPRLEPFLEEMKSSEKLFGHLPPCRMNNQLWKSLLKLLEREGTKGEDLESMQSTDAKELIDAYQSMLDIKYAHRAYHIRNYLEENYADPMLSNPALAGIFNTTEKTLIETFREEFNTTPHNFLIKLRMDHARTLLETGTLAPQGVCSLVGYRDFRSFGLQFKKYFGFPPSHYR
ncbi:MAG: AraC family transcriptional regulator [Sphingobacteriales bacterium]|nr:MAG: AraC family transcriptional regulator [Sphingobacteriales bacterium]